MAIEMTLKLEQYRCDSCSLERRETVQALVRMIPYGVMIDGKIIIDEWWCCPRCFEPKFQAKRGKDYLKPHPNCKRNDVVPA